MARVLRFAPLAVALLLPTSATAIAFLPSSQERLVSSCAGFAYSPVASCAELPSSDRDSDSATAADLSPFDASVSSNFNAPNGGFAIATAAQQSAIHATGIEATGSVYSSAFAGPHLAESESTFPIE